MGLHKLKNSIFYRGNLIFMLRCDWLNAKQAGQAHSHKTAQLFSYGEQCLKIHSSRKTGRA